MDKPADPTTPFGEVYQAFLDDLALEGTKPSTFTVIDTTSCRGGIVVFDGCVGGRDRRVAPLSDGTRVGPDGCRSTHRGHAFLESVDQLIRTSRSGRAKGEGKRRTTVPQIDHLPSGSPSRSQMHGWIHADRSPTS